MGFTINIRGQQGGVETHKRDAAGAAVTFAHPFVEEGFEVEIIDPKGVRYEPKRFGDLIAAWLPRPSGPKPRT